MKTPIFDKELIYLVLSSFRKWSPGNRNTWCVGMNILLIMLLLCSVSIYYKINFVPKTRNEKIVEDHHCTRIFNFNICLLFGEIQKYTY